MKKSFLNSLPALIIWLVASVITYGQSVPDKNVQFPGKKTTWKGFARYDFEFNGRACRMVCPDKPATGNPWIWNARFPDWHTDIDSILLIRGFYVTNINTDEFNGCPEGVKIWDEYFRYITTTFGLENVAALEGISRGLKSSFRKLHLNSSRQESLHLDRCLMHSGFIRTSSQRGKSIFFSSRQP
jgi:hypothetical protein